MNVTVRSAVEGLSLEFEYLTARNAASHCATVAVEPDEVSVITPVVALYAAEMLPIVTPSLVNDRTSWPVTKPVPIETVAFVSVELSASDTDIVGLTAVAASFSV